MQNQAVVLREPGSNKNQAVDLQEQGITSYRSIGRSDSSKLSL
jgi:hypothetical protein